MFQDYPSCFVISYPERQYEKTHSRCTTLFCVMLPEDNPSLGYTEIVYSL